MLVSEQRTIPEDEVTEKDTVLDTFIKDAVTEEVEKEDGTKETVEKVPAKKMKLRL